MRVRYLLTMDVPSDEVASFERKNYTDAWFFLYHIAYEAENNRGVKVLSMQPVPIKTRKRKS